VTVDGVRSGDENACGGGYRGYLNDVWRSKDGSLWNLVTQDPGWRGRGEHKVFVMADLFWMVGGRIGHSWSVKSESFMNDVWGSPDGISWAKYQEHAEWEPRGAFGVAVKPKTKRDPIDRVYLCGGHSGPILDTNLEENFFDDGGENRPRTPLTYHNDCWEWQPPIALGQVDPWLRDFNESAPEASSYRYVFENSGVERLRLVVPMDIIRPQDPSILAEEGIYTVKDLASIGRDKVLKLRLTPAGSTNPAKIPHICDQKRLAIAVMDKCRVQEEDWLKTESQQQIIHEVYADVDGNEIVSERSEAYTGWLYPNENRFQQDESENVKTMPETDLSAKIERWDEAVESWDGCSQIGERGKLDMVNSPSEGPDKYADVEGIPQIQGWMQTWRILEELQCRNIWSPRSHVHGTLFQGDIFMIGGRSGDAARNFSNEVWYRDAELPQTTFTNVPGDRSPDNSFSFSADEEGCIFQWRLNDLSENRVEKNWTTSGETVNIDWLELGFHRFRVRAIDPANNVEEDFEEGRNQHTWYHTPALPVGLIVGCVLGFFAFCAGVYLEFRRRRRKAAMERYAVKRMRRKFRGAQGRTKEKEVDWKKYGKQAKDAAKKAHKKKKAGAVDGSAKTKSKHKHKHKHKHHHEHGESHHAKKKNKENSHPGHQHRNHHGKTAAADNDAPRTHHQHKHKKKKRT